MHDLALRAQVLQGYEEFKVRANLCRPLYARQRRRDPFIYQLFFFVFVVAYPWVVRVRLWHAGTAGAGAAVGEVLHGVGLEVGYRGGFRIWELSRCVPLAPSFVAFT